MSNYRAPDQLHQVDSDKVFTDTRSTFAMLVDGIRQPAVSTFILVTLVASLFFIPALAILNLIIAFIIYKMSATLNDNLILPIHLPQHTNIRDRNNLKPGGENRRAINKKYEMAQGTFFLGTVRRTIDQIWMSASAFLTHTLLIGTTGAGKTEALISLAFNPLSMGAGLLYLDAKAAPKLVFQIVTILKLMGRIDDFRVINYSSTSTAASDNATYVRNSNTNNPFAIGSADDAVQMLTSIIPSGGGDNQIFVERAIGLISAVMPALVELRDNHDFHIYPSLINDYTSLGMFVSLSDDDRLSDASKKILLTYLRSLPGYDEDAHPSRQPEEVGKLFGLAQAYFTRALSSLSDTYGHIYNTSLAEVDYLDVILRSRVLLILIPAMGKSPEERKNLGKVNLSGLRAAMAVGLGDKLEGWRADVLESLPTASAVPSLLLIDEYPEVSVEGFAVVATQGRGLGFGVVFAGQDYSGFMRASEIEAGMIYSNTKIKIIMAIEDSEDTFQRIQNLASEVWVNANTGYHNSENGIDPYKRNMETHHQKESRINFLDLKEQEMGQAHIFYKGGLHRANLFWHGFTDNDVVTHFRLNRQIMINPPSDTLVNAWKEEKKRADDLKEWLEALDKGYVSFPDLDVQDELKALHEYSSNTTRFHPLEAFARYCQVYKEEQTHHSSQELDDMDENDLLDDGDNRADINAAIMALNTPSNTPTEANDISPPIADSMEQVVDGWESMDEDGGGRQLEESLYTEQESAQRPVLTDEKVDEILETAEHGWIYSDLDPDDTDNHASDIFDYCTEINNSLGMDDKVSRTEAAETISAITDSTIYPSEPCILPDELDRAMLWDAIDKVTS